MNEAQAQVAARYRPVPMPVPWPPPAKRDEPLRHCRPDPVYGALAQEARLYAKVLAIAAALMIALCLVEAALTPNPRLSLRLVRAEGLGLRDCEPRDQSPRFLLAVDVDAIQEKGLLVGEPVIHVGGDGEAGDHALRVSYRGVVLAWGAVPRFTISHGLLGDQAAGVVTVVTTADAFVLREEMRKLIRAERQSFGKVEFEADGDIPGLGGHLHCKFYYLADENHRRVEDVRPPCLVQKN